MGTTAGYSAIFVPRSVRRIGFPKIVACQFGGRQDDWQRPVSGRTFPGQGQIYVCALRNNKSKLQPGEVAHIITL